MSQFWHFVSANFGEQALRKTRRSINRTLAQLLLVADAMLVTQQHVLSRGDDGGQQQLSGEEVAALRRCPHCFQLIAVDLMLNSTLDPFVLEVICQPNMQEGVRDEAAVSGKVKKAVLADMFNLLAADTQVVPDVLEALEEVITENQIGIMGANCLISHEVCLSQEDLSYLLQSRREDLSKGQFAKLYPAVGMESMKALIDELSVKIVGAEHVQNNDAASVAFHKTADLHPLLMAVERFYYRHIVDAAVSDDDNAHGNIRPKLEQLHNDQPRNASSAKKASYVAPTSGDCSDGEFEWRTIDGVRELYISNARSERSNG